MIFRALFAGGLFHFELLSFTVVATTRCCSINMEAIGSDEEKTISGQEQDKLRLSYG